MPEGGGRGREGGRGILAISSAYGGVLSVGEIGWIISCGVECSEWPGFML